MITFPNAKINLGLNVLERRDDGFHNISSVMVPIGFKDVLEILPHPDQAFDFEQTGLVIPGDKQENLCSRAYRLLRDKVGLGGVRMHLHKAIPAGTGLGGGSSDGAAALVMLNELFQGGLDTHELSLLAAQLGSDCPFFILNQPAYASGRGEVLESIGLDLHGLALFLVMPGVHISTAKAYSNIIPSVPEYSPRVVVKEDIKLWREYLVNDFEGPVFKEFPRLKGIKDRLYELGAIYASMSGSGSAIFGIFETINQKVEREFQGMVTWRGKW